MAKKNMVEKGVVREEMSMLRVFGKVKDSKDLFTKFFARSRKHSLMPPTFFCLEKEMSTVGRQM